MPDANPPDQSGPTTIPMSDAEVENFIKTQLTERFRAPGDSYERTVTGMLQGSPRVATIARTFIDEYLPIVVQDLEKALNDPKEHAEQCLRFLDTDGQYLCSLLVVDGCTLNEAKIRQMKRTLSRVLHANELVVEIDAQMLATDIGHSSINETEEQ